MFRSKHQWGYHAVVVALLFSLFGPVSTVSAQSIVYIPYLSSSRPLVTDAVAPEERAAQGIHPVQYYVSVGTSLAAGIQKDRKTGESIRTEDAYTDQIHQRVRGQIQNLQHEKLGCAGETSAGMISGEGSLCTYEGAGSQLLAAEAFLQAHPGEIAFITIDIGANDVLHCLEAEDIQGCVAQSLGTLQVNLVQILTRLKTAAPGVPILAINYYNPYLADWLDGPAGEANAIATTNLVLGINSLLGQIYGAFGIPVADVSGAFVTADFTMQGNMPHNVKTICQLTWNCDEEFPNVHPNGNGYKVIARTVEQLMRDLGLI